jgi:hypothetical protein
MQILALGITISDSKWLMKWIGKERSHAFWCTTLIRILCMMVATAVSASNLGFVNLLNLTGSWLGLMLNFVFPVNFDSPKILFFINYFSQHGKQDSREMMLLKVLLVVNIFLTAWTFLDALAKLILT